MTGEQKLMCFNSTLQLRGRPKMMWMEVINNDMKLLELEKRMVVDRND